MITKNLIAILMSVFFIWILTVCCNITPSAQFVVIKSSYGGSEEGKMTIRDSTRVGVWVIYDNLRHVVARKIYQDDGEIVADIKFYDSIAYEGKIFDENDLCALFVKRTRPEYNSIDTCDDQIRGHTLMANSCNSCHRVVYNNIASSGITVRAFDSLNRVMLLSNKLLYGDYIVYTDRGMLNSEHIKLFSLSECDKRALRIFISQGASMTWRDSR